MNRNKEGEAGKSECEITQTRYLEAEELREIWDLSWKSSFQNNLVPVVCIILTSVLRRFLLTSLTFFFFFLEHSSDPSSCFSLLLLSPGSHTVANHSAYSIQFVVIVVVVL